MRGRYVLRPTQKCVKLKLNKKPFSVRFSYTLVYLKFDLLCLLHHPLLNPGKYNDQMGWEQPHLAIELAFVKIKAKHLEETIEIESIDFDCIDFLDLFQCRLRKTQYKISSYFTIKLVFP